MVVESPVEVPVMRIPTLSLLVPAGVLLAASVCSALDSGPDLTGSWRSVQMLAPAPKPNQPTILEGILRTSMFVT